MIVKSMSRKSMGGIQKLLKYVNKEKNSSSPLLWNLESQKNNLKEIGREFLKNKKYLKARKNGVVLYHEIISFNALDKQKISPEILLDVARKYISLRAEKALAYAMPHIEEADNPHVHIVISANDYRDVKKIRLSKFEFQKIKKQLENYQKERYPELTHSRVNHSRTEKIRKKRGEREHERRRQGQNKKDFLAQKIKKMLLQAFSFSEFKNSLENKGFKLYQRGKNYGVINLKTGRKHRLTTLGIQGFFFEKIDQWEKSKNRTLEIDKIYYQKSLNLWQKFGFKEELLQNITEVSETPREEELRRLQRHKRTLQREL